MIKRINQEGDTVIVSQDQLDGIIETLEACHNIVDRRDELQAWLERLGLRVHATIIPGITEGEWACIPPPCLSHSSDNYTIRSGSRWVATVGSKADAELIANTKRLVNICVGIVQYTHGQPCADCIHNHQGLLNTLRDILRDTGVPDLYLG